MNLTYFLPFQTVTKVGHSPASSESQLRETETMMVGKCGKWMDEGVVTGGTIASEPSGREPVALLPVTTKYQQQDNLSGQPVRNAGETAIT